MPQTTRLQSLPASQMEPSNLTAIENFTTGDKTELIHTASSTPDGSTFTGVWECAPNRVEIDAYPVHEMMTVISGSVTVTNEGESPQIFNAGDTFMIPRGTKCVWEITKKLKKYFMITAS